LFGMQVLRYVRGLLRKCAGQCVKYFTILFEIK